MNTQSSIIVQPVRNHCNVLQDDGISYSDYVEQLTYLLFLKMDYESSTMLGKKGAIPADLNWSWSSNHYPMAFAGFSKAHVAGWTPARRMSSTSGNER